MILRVIIVKNQSAPKSQKLTLDCKLLKYFTLADKGRFILKLDFNFPSAESLNERLSLLAEDKESSEYDINCIRYMINDLQGLHAFSPDGEDNTRSTLSLEFPFETSDGTMMNPNEKNANKKQDQVIIPKTLSLSFCRLSPNMNSYFWKPRPPQQIIKPIRLEGGGKTLLGGRMDVPKAMHMTYIKKPLPGDRDEKKEEATTPHAGTPANLNAPPFEHMNSPPSNTLNSENVPISNFSPKNPNLPPIGTPLDLNKPNFENMEKPAKGEETRKSAVEKLGGESSGELVFSFSFFYSVNY